MSNGEDDNDIHSISPSSSYRKKMIEEQQARILQDDRMNRLREDDVQKLLDNEVVSVCKKCVKLLDKSDYYGASPHELETGEFFFCKAAPRKNEDSFKQKDPITGKYKIKSRSIDRITPGLLFHIDDPAGKFDRCVYVNNGKCKMYEENKKI